MRPSRVWEKEREERGSVGVFIYEYVCVRERDAMLLTQSLFEGFHVASFGAALPPYFVVGTRMT